MSISKSQHGVETMQNEFFQAIAPQCKSILKEHTEKLGFNAFALMSDLYKRENFHSDILREILDPHGTHQEGSKFLRLFIEALTDAANEEQRNILKKISWDDDIRVTREEDRTDIAIYSNTGSWCIIVENKINGAPDMARQLPRYFDYWQRVREKKNIKAVVYMTAVDNVTFPTSIGWSISERTEIKKLLLLFPGFSDKNNCIWAWLRKCELETQYFNNKAVFAQYAAVVKQQAGKVMDKEEIDCFLEQTQNYKVNITGLRDIIDKLPEYYSNYFFENLKNNGVLKKVWIWRTTVTVLEDYEINFSNGFAYLAMDIHCEALSTYGISIFLRRNETGLSFHEVMKPAELVLKKNNFNIYTGIWKDRYIWQLGTNYPSKNDLADISRKINGFLKELDQQFKHQFRE